MDEAHIYIYKIYDEEPKPHTKINYLRNWPKMRYAGETLSRCFGQFRKCTDFSMRLRFLIVYFIIIDILKTVHILLSVTSGVLLLI